MLNKQKTLGRDGGVYVRVAGTTRLAKDVGRQQLRSWGVLIERDGKDYPSNAFAYMNLIEHWGSGIPRIIDKVKAAGLQEPEFIGGEVDLRINIYRSQSDTNNAMINANGIESGVNGANCGTNGVEVTLNKEQTQIEKLLQIIEKNLYRKERFLECSLLYRKKVDWYRAEQNEKQIGKL